MRIEIRTGGHNRGMVTIVFVILMGLMAAYVISNAVGLRHLKRELQLVEQRQKDVHTKALVEIRAEE